MAGETSHNGSNTNLHVTFADHDIVKIHENVPTEDLPGTIVVSEEEKQEEEEDQKTVAKTPVSLPQPNQQEPLVRCKCILMGRGRVSGTSQEVIFEETPL